MTAIPTQGKYSGKQTAN